MVARPGRVPILDENRERRESGRSWVKTVVNRSQQAARFGRLAEEAAARRYGLVPEHDDWHDLRDLDSDTPFDVKAAMLSRRSPRFRLWREQHSRLIQESGGYVFVAYVPRGRGIEVKKIRSLSASSLSLTFGGAGDHPKGRQVKVKPGSIF